MNKPALPAFLSLVLLLSCLVFPGFAEVAPEPAGEGLAAAEGDYVFSLGLDAGIESDLFLTWGGSASSPLLPQYGSGQNLSLEAYLPLGLLLRPGLSYFSVEPSAYDSQGTRYRSFAGFSGSLLLGYRFARGDFGSLSVGAGGALSLVRDPLSDQYSAFYSAKVELASRSAWGTDPLALRAALPLELIYRGGSLSFKAGLAFALGLGR